jgi:prepilin-type N-terminal cleavage/methylation domain-containing protein
MYLRIKIKPVRGITLIELLMSMALFSVIIAVALSVFVVSLKIWDSNKSRADIRQDGSLAMEKMVRYLELADNITAATTSSITFSADINNDGTDETVTFAFDGVNKKLDQTINGVIIALARRVQNFDILYYRSNTETSFTPLVQADRNNIRIVNLSLIMSERSDTVSFGSSAYCRNQSVVSAGPPPPKGI